MAMYKILSNVGDTSSCALYRNFLPHLKLRDELKAQGIQLDAYMSLKNLNIDDYDCFIFGRLPVNPNMYIYIDGLRRKGKKIIWDVDDELWNIPDANKYKKEYDEKVMWLNYYFAMASRIISSTDNLKDSILKRFPMDSDRVVVLENLICSEDYDGYFPHHIHFGSNPIKILYSGSDSHAGDMGPISGLFEHYYENKNIMFIFYGYLPPGLEAENPRKVMHLHWSPSRKYYEGMLSFLSPHIALMPLHDNNFNRCKSSIKHYEMSMSGSVCIGSNIPPYVDTIIHQVTGYLCSDNPQDWILACDYIINDRRKMAEIALSGREYVIENYSWNTNNRRRNAWFEFFKSIPDM